MLKRFLFLSVVFVLVVSVFAGLPANAQATDNGGETEEFKKISYVLFHLETCPHCRDEIKFLNKKLFPKYGEYIDFKIYEVSDRGNQEIFEQYGKFHDVQVGSVPMAFIDGQIVSGYGKDSTTGKQIMGIVERILEEKGVLGTDEAEGAEGGQLAEGQITLPILGTINPATFSLPLLTLTLGLLDGFNPCAMWILLFLITLLFGMKDRKKMWLLGGIFILTSGIVYFIFMAAWLEFILFIGLIAAVRWVIGLLAIGVGGSTLRQFWKNRKAEGVVCKVSSHEGNKKIFERLKEIVQRKHLFWSIVGIVLLGFSVNLVELACSAGFPAVFTQVLAMSDIANWQRYGYMLGYITLYMIDDMIVFVVAMVTLRATGIGGKYAKYINAFSGLLIFILGLLLILKPEWLMFT